MYQPQKAYSNDPNGAISEGVTLRVNGLGPRYSAIFVETIRDGVAGFGELHLTDFVDRMDRITSHEIGHGPNDPWGHPEGGLMNEYASEPNFSAATLKRFRQAYR